MMHSPSVFEYEKIDVGMHIDEDQNKSTEIGYPIE